MRNRFGDSALRRRVVALGDYAFGVESVAGEDQALVLDAHGFHHFRQMAGPADHMQDDKTRHVAMLENRLDVPARVEIDVIPVPSGEEHGLGAEAGGGG